MSYSIWLDNSKNQSTKNYDVVIVGGGISGVSTAYWLKKEDPSLTVAIVDKAELAGGATGRNAGFITCGSVEHFNRLVETHGRDKAHKIWNFSEQNLELLKSEVIKDQGATLDFDPCGTFSLASEDNEMAELKRTAELMQEMNIAVEVLDSAAVLARTGGQGFVGGIKYLGDACVHPVKLSQKILELSGADFLAHTEVGEIEDIGDGVRKLHTNRGAIECSMVALAGNGYLPAVSDYFKDKIYPTRGQILVTEPVEKFMEAPCYAHFVLDYFRQLPSGELLIGGFRQLEKETEVGYSDHITDKIQQALYEFTQKHLPKFAGCKVTHRWAGVMGFSADGQQMIGALPNDPQVYFLGGFTAHGLGLAFHTGKCLTDLIFGREIPEFISARRF